jgi:hypothetical protein
MNNRFGLFKELSKGDKTIETSSGNLFNKDWLLRTLLLDKVSIRKFKIKSIFKNDIE